MCTSYFAYDYSTKPVQMYEYFEDHKCDLSRKNLFRPLKTFAYLLHPNKSVCYDFLQT